MEMINRAECFLGGQQVNVPDSAEFITNTLSSIGDEFRTFRKSTCKHQFMSFNYRQNRVPGVGIP